MPRSLLMRYITQKFGGFGGGAPLGHPVCCWRTDTLAPLPSIPIAAVEAWAGYYCWAAHVAALEWGVTLAAAYAPTIRGFSVSITLASNG